MSERIFVAIDLPISVKRKLSVLQGILTGKHWPVRWEEPGKVHLTIAFLGKLGRRESDGFLIRELERAVQAIRPFELWVGGLGALPNFIKPRIIYLRVGGNLERLSILQRRVSHGLKKAGIRFDEKPFVPHLTIGRVERRISGAGLRKLGREIQRTEGINLGAKIRVDSLAVMESRSQPHGAAYRKLAVVKIS